MRPVTWWLQLGNPKDWTLETKKQSMLVLSIFKDSIKQTWHTAKIVSDNFPWGWGNKEQNLM
jgi:hypothetical protein